MTRLSYDGNYFFFKCSYENRSLPKDSGFRWSTDLKTWYTPDIAVAAKLRRYSDPLADAKLKSVMITDLPWSYAAPQDYLPEGMTLMPHQIEAVKFALTRSRSYLGLDPGLGKTIVAATIAAMVKQFIVYIAPPFLIYNVENEFLNWAPQLYVNILGRDKEIDGDVLIIPDSMLSLRDVHNLVSMIVSKHDGVPYLIIDEAHRYKNDESNRTRALFGHKPKIADYKPGVYDIFSRHIFMSGTPMPNRPMELFPLLSKAAPETIDFMNRFDYGRKYCAGYKTEFGWDFKGASNLHELRPKLVYPEGKFLLRLKKNILKLPPKIEEVLVIGDRGQLSPAIAKMDESVTKHLSADRDINDQDLINKFAEILKTNEVHLASYRRLLGLEKVDIAAEYIRSIIDETDESIIVFAYHKEVIAALEKHLKEYTPIVCTGDHSKEERHAKANMFQASKKDRILLANYIAMGVGYTLTKATRVIFVEFSWVVGENDQASDRAHRIGQNESVLVQYLVYKDSIEKKMIESHIKKRKAIGYV